MPNAWNNRLFKPSYPRIPAESYSREDDITFSFKRATSSFSSVLTKFIVEAEEKENTVNMENI